MKAKNAAVVRAAVESDIRDGFTLVVTLCAERDSGRAE